MRRNEKFLRLILYGASYTDVAKQHGITPVRVRQIINREVYKLRNKIHIQDTGNKIRCFSDIPSYYLKTLKAAKNRILTILNEKEEL